MSKSSFLFLPCFPLVPHSFPTILPFCTTYPLRSGVCVCVCVCLCVSVCSVIAAHWKPQRGQPQESLTVVSGSPLFNPPFFFLLLPLFLYPCPIHKPHHPHPSDCCLSKIPPILISFRNSLTLLNYLFFFYLSWSILHTVFPSFLFYFFLSSPPPRIALHHLLSPPLNWLLHPPSLTLTLCPFWLEQGPLTPAPELVLCFITCARLCA